MNRLTASSAGATLAHGAKKTAQPFKLRYKLAALAIALIFGLLAIELLLRLFAPQHPSWLAIYRNHPTVDTYSLQPNISTLVDTGEVRYAVATDENGWRVGPGNDDTVVGDTVVGDTVVGDTVVGDTVDERPRMLVVGDSYAFGQGVSYEQSLVGVLAAAPDMPLRPINAAVGGYGPIQYRMILQHLLGENLHPGFVLVVVYPGNDFHDCLWDKNSRVREGIINNPRSVRSWIKRSSHLYRFAANLYHQYGPANSNNFAKLRRELATESNWETGRLAGARTIAADELARIKLLCDQHAVPLGIVLIPVEHSLKTGAAAPATAPDVEYDYSLPGRHAQAICDELGLRCLDLAPTLAPYPTDDTYLRFDGHFTPQANRLAAEAISKFFVELHAKDSAAKID